nr:hypothetical protein [Butyrivibrio sp.]
TFKEAFEQLRIKNKIDKNDMVDMLHTSLSSLKRWLLSPDENISIDFVVAVSLMLQLPDWISDLLFDRAGKQLSDKIPRHRALKYILRVMWMDGIDKANEFLEKKGFKRLNIG